jgi:hypothetical protein
MSEARDFRQSLGNRVGEAVFNTVLSAPSYNFDWAVTAGLQRPLLSQALIRLEMRHMASLVRSQDVNGV